MLVLVAALAGAAAAAAVLSVRRGAAGSDALVRIRSEVSALGERVHHDSTEVARRLEGIDARIATTLSSSADLATGIYDTLGDVRRATETVAERAREFSALQDLLRAPKARGGLGEALLEELLRQLLPPPAYAMQHRFSTGATVDAVVKIGGRLVCIDSKFPLANFRRMCDASDPRARGEAERAFAHDVAQHIDAISTRYVVPDEGTFDFAVMYVPADGVYAEMLRLDHRGRPLYEAAIEARVVPMSPLTMCGYLQTVLFGLKCLSIERSAEQILGFCGRLQQDMDRFATEYEVLGRHLANARTKYEDGSRRLDRFRDKLDHVIDLGDDSGGGDTPPPLEAVAE